ncbi:MAG: protease inhibitor I42 family protein [Methanotrichaceae archaeon]|nr:protease inhibitor I42 family protein [Methanotrichaceae archaeon]
MNIGDNFTISLESNPGSSGYDWWVDFDSLYIQLEEKNFKVDEKDKLIGQPGMKYFTFAAKKLGSTYISMLLVRPWKNSTVADLKIYPVNIVQSHQSDSD